MTLRVTGGRPGIRPSAGARGRVSYGSATRRGLRSGTLRFSAAGVHPSRWHRLADDRDFVGSKLLVLAALLALTALLERVV